MPFFIMNLSMAIRAEDCASCDLLEYAFNRYAIIDRAPDAEILLAVVVKFQARRMIFRALLTFERALKVV